MRVFSTCCKVDNAKPSTFSYETLRGGVKSLFLEYEDVGIGEGMVVERGWERLGMEAAGYEIVFMRCIVWYVGCRVCFTCRGGGCESRF